MKERKRKERGRGKRKEMKERKRKGEDTSGGEKVETGTFDNLDGELALLRQIGKIKRNSA